MARTAAPTGSTPQSPAGDTPPVTATGANTDTDTAGQTPGRPPGHDPLEQAATVLALPFTMARQLLPDNPVPLLLGTGALAVAGLVEWPVVAAVGLGYAALRFWHTPHPAGGERTAHPKSPGLGDPAR